MKTEYLRDFSEKSQDTYNFSKLDFLTVILLAVAPIVRLALLTGPVGSDDIKYFQFAQKLYSLTAFSELHHGGGRLFFLIVIGGLAVLGGSIKAGAIGSIFFLSIRDLIAVAFVRRRMGAAASVCAAALLSLNASSTAYAGLMLPDPLLSLTMFGSALLVFHSAQVSEKRRLHLVIFAGAAAAISYSIKESGILIVPTSLLFLVSINNKSLRQVLTGLGAYFLGFAAIFFFEVGSYYFLSGDALYRFHAISLVHNATITESKTLVDFLRHGYWNLNYVMSYTATSTPILLLALGVWGYSLIRRDSYVFFALSGIFIGLYFIFGTSSFSRLMPLPVQDRYFEPLLPFLAVSLGALVSRIEQTKMKTANLLACTLPIAITLISLPSTICKAGDITFAEFGKNSAIAMNALTRSYPNTPIYVSSRLKFRIEPFVDAKLFGRLLPIPNEGVLPDGFYMFDPPRKNDETSEISHQPYNDNIQEMRAAEVQAIGPWLVIDEDQSYLGNRESKIVTRIDHVTRAAVYKRIASTVTDIHKWTTIVLH